MTHLKAFSLHSVGAVFTSPKSTVRAAGENSALQLSQLHALFETEMPDSCFNYLRLVAVFLPLANEALTCEKLV